MISFQVSQTYLHRIKYVIIVALKIMRWIEYWTLAYDYLTLFILMDCPMHVGRISMELHILYFKGLHVEIISKL